MVSPRPPWERTLRRRAHSVWDAVYTGEQAERGRAFYAKECASCHGEGLMGQDQAPGLVGPAFLANWNGQTVAAISSSRRASPCRRDNPNSFSRQEYLDVVAFMLKANGFPAGKTELPRSTADLTALRISQYQAGREVARFTRAACGTAPVRQTVRPPARGRRS